MSLRALIGLQCGEIADLVFPHNMDRGRRERLALALVELTRLLRDSDGSGEAGQTRSEAEGLDPKGDSAGPKDIAHD